jgi:hypothetical protein
MKHDREFNLVFNLVARQVESQKGIPLTPETKWIGDCQPLAAKFLMHAASQHHLAQGTLFRNGFESLKGPFIDVSSIFVLARAAYECYLAFNYIYVSSNEQHLGPFRYNLWDLGCLLDRQSFPASEEETIRKKKEEQPLVDELLHTICSSEAFKILPPADQKAAQAGKWRMRHGWPDLAEMAGLSRTDFIATYRYLCSYAHSGNLSIFQLSQLKDSSAASEMAELALDITLGNMAHFSADYARLFPRSQEVIDQDLVAAEQAYIFDGFGRVFDETESTP